MGLSGTCHLGMSHYPSVCRDQIWEIISVESRSTMSRAIDGGENCGEKGEILKSITEFYTSSYDFNGIPLADLSRKHKMSRRELTRILSSLIRENKILLNYDPENPHIKRWGPEPGIAQIEKLPGADIRFVCAYPSVSSLKEVVDPTKYIGRPFALRLALGEPQLAFISFDLTVLEFYRNDPRYYYDNDDIDGSISVHDDSNLADHDQVLLQSFGFSYDANLNRAVAVFLRYLADLSPEHQQIWNAQILKGDYRLHPDYARAAIAGEWYEGISVFDAFVEEIHHINEMCKLIPRPPLFKYELSGDKKPREFCFLIRPTLKEFNAFVHTLDKAVSENINREFFVNDLAFEAEEKRKDGKIVVRQKGTIQILDEWLKLKFRIADRTPIDEMIATFKEIRQLRQKPAHSLAEDSFDQKYFQQQRDIMVKAYDGARTLRLIFAQHPSAKEYKIPDWQEDVKIWTY